MDLPSPDLGRIVAVALDATHVAGDALRAVVAPPELPKGRNRAFIGPVARWLSRGVLVPGPDQIRRTCDSLDECASALHALAARSRDAELERHASTAATWSDRLWRSNDEAGDVYREVNDVAAVLSRCHRNAVLKRPLLQRFDH